MESNQTTNEKAVLDIDHAFDHPERIKLLEVIDQFRELGLSEEVSLPQLVVAGDQSSGKSSLLEGLTGLNFPVASDLCTRFATQIVLRRGPIADSQIIATIIPSPELQENETSRNKLVDFHHIINSSLPDWLDCYDRP